MENKVIPAPSETCSLSLTLDGNFRHTKQIKLGTGLKTSRDFYLAFKADGYTMQHWAEYMIRQKSFSVYSEEITANLELFHVGELGFKDKVTFLEIYKRIIEIGKKPCPSEVGPQLRRQFKNQPLNDRILVIMEPIKDRFGNPRIFVIAHTRVGPWLTSCKVRSEEHTSELRHSAKSRMPSSA